MTVEDLLAALTARMSEEDAEAVAVAFEAGDSPEELAERIRQAFTRKEVNMVVSPIAEEAAGVTGLDLDELVSQHVESGRTVSRHGFEDHHGEVLELVIISEGDTVRVELGI
jgi:hypothetical protein